MAIETFSGDYRFLSNFFPCRVEWEGLGYPSVEHAYQAAKSTDLGARMRIQAALKPGDAKRAGNNVQLRPGWEGMKLEVMEALLRFKFVDPWLRDKLLATGDQELV